jgi:hypothetical protein
VPVPWPPRPPRSAVKPNCQTTVVSNDRSLLVSTPSSLFPFQPTDNSRLVERNFRRGNSEPSTNSTTGEKPAPSKTWRLRTVLNSEPRLSRSRYPLPQTSPLSRPWLCRFPFMLATSGGVDLPSICPSRTCARDEAAVSQRSAWNKVRQFA